MDEDLFLRKRALGLCQEGQRVQLEGDLAAAMALYSESLEIFPTAEAHTFLGWAFSVQDRFDEAIAACKRAIALDPAFGNPYNDIGSYLIAQGKLEEAPRWLQKAKRAARYECRHYPYINLGRLFASRGWVAKAIGEFETALRLAPDEPGVASALTALRQRIN